MNADALYDRIGHGYASIRRADPRLAEPIWQALGDARSVINIGAGTGSYEPPDREVIAVEPSRLMIAQRARDAAPAVQTVAEDLPFEDDSFDAAMAIITLHHWRDVNSGLVEMMRVARRRVVVVAFDPRAWSDQWIVRDYLPEIMTCVAPPHPSIGQLLDVLLTQGWSRSSLHATVRIACSPLSGRGRSSISILRFGPRRRPGISCQMRPRAEH